MMHEFAGKWITDDTFAGLAPVNVFHRSMERLDIPSGPQNCHILFRRHVTYTGGQAKVFITADDYYLLYVNGQFVTGGPAPGNIFAYYYNEIDVTSYLHPGDNVLAIHTYYQGLINRQWISGDRRHGLLFDLVCDGRVIACSDTVCRTARHTGYTGDRTVGYDTDFAEDYDSRAPEDGFFLPDFDDGGWEYARERAAVDYVLTPQPTDQLEYTAIEPKTVTPTADGVVADFGFEFVGMPALTVRGRPGDTVTVLCGEELQEDGTVRWQMRCNCDYRELWTLSGGDDILHPFAYKAFRYLQLILPTGAQLLHLGATVRHYPYRAVTDCAYDDPALRRIFTLCADTIRYGVQEAYLDCPSREKGQYFGDTAYSALAHVMLTGDGAMFRKFIRNALETAHIDPGLMAEGPCSFMQEIADYTPIVVIATRFYTELTGDIAFAREMLAPLGEVLTVYRRRYGRADGLIAVNDKWNLVDWPASARDGYDFDLTEGKRVDGVHNVMNAYYLLALRSHDRLCRMCGQPSVFPELAEQVAAAYRTAFYDEENRRFTDAEGSSHSSLGAKVFGALTETAEEDALHDAVAAICEKRLSCSNFMVTAAMFVLLERSGEKELLLDLIREPTAWCHMLAEGATTTFEAFGKDKKWNTSLFHPVFTFPVLFLTGHDWFPKSKRKEENT